MKPQKDKHYMIYGKMGSMKVMRPVNGDSFVVNKINAEVYSPMTDDDVAKLERELKFMQSQGEFELREVK